MEQELASIFSFVLKSADCPQPYYRNIPQDFVVPSVYFPVPEIATSGDTFNTYGVEYDWYIKFFHSTTQGAYLLALKALTDIKKNRNLIPLLDINGKKNGEGIRIKDPDLRIVDECAVQLNIRFTSRRPYEQTDSEKMQTFEIFEKLKNQYKEEFYWLRKMQKQKRKSPQRANLNSSLKSCRKTVESFSAYLKAFLLVLQPGLQKENIL